MVSYLLSISHFLSVLFGMIVLKHKDLLASIKAKAYVLDYNGEVVAKTVFAFKIAQTLLLTNCYINCWNIFS